MQKTLEENIAGITEISIDGLITSKVGEGILALSQFVGTQVIQAGCEIIEAISPHMFDSTMSYMVTNAGELIAVADATGENIAYAIASAIQDADIGAKQFIKNAAKISALSGGTNAKDNWLGMPGRKKGDLSGLDVVFNEKNKKHIFDSREGHLIDTLENRDQITGLVKDSKNYLGPDIHDNQWFGEILPDGTQLCGQTRGTTITNCGLNEIPIEYNPITGLCSQKPLH